MSLKKLSLIIGLFLGLLFFIDSQNRVTAEEPSLNSSGPSVNPQPRIEEWWF